MRTKFSFLIFFIIILIFLKTDFRLEEDIYCCGDDHDYYSHSETIGIDFDFDYSNQLKNYENARFNKNNKPAPIGFVGSGLLSAPFIFFGNLIDKIFKLNSGVNFKILFYSMSSIFYLYLSVFYLVKTKNLINSEFKNLHLIILFLGSGISYYSFERFSMTHTFEVYSITMIIYFTFKILLEKNYENYFNYFALAFFLFLSFNIRWVNYFSLLIPFLLFQLHKIQISTLFKSKTFCFSLTSFFIFTIILNYKIYGILTLNPNSVYSKGDLGSSFSIFANVFITFKSFLTILFSQEFGIFYFSPIIFAGFFIIFNKLIKDRSIYSTLGTLMFLQVFAIVVIWQSTASSYGFRYLFCLTPLALIIFLDWFRNSQFKYKNLILNFSLIMSVFSLISTIFFETTIQTQLSIEEQINAFGNLVRYTEPEYLSGYLKSFFEINSYLKIFVTSFLGLIFFNLLFKIITVDQFLEFVSNFGLNLNDEKVFNLLNKYSNLELSYLVVVIIISIFLTNFCIKTLRYEIKNY